MREDMAKLIVERPRRGGGMEKGGKKRAEREAALDIAPKIETIKPRGKGGRKCLNENLAPLYRWLDRQVGRPWNKVNSELRQQVDARSAVRLHIIQHVDRHVEENAVFKDGKIYSSEGSYGQGRYELAHLQLYVDPKTGILRRCERNRSAERKAYHSRKDSPDIVRASKTLLYRRGGTSGAWYALELAPLPDKPYYSAALKRWEVDRVADAWVGHSIGLVVPTYYARIKRLDRNLESLNEYMDGHVYCKSFRQLSSKEIRKQGLSTSVAA